METLRYWSKGVRLYIALSSGLITLSTFWWAHAAYGGSQLSTIRTQETFAWLATGLIALAVSIGPAYKLFPHLAGKQLMFDARRLIGVSAAWFASLHVGLAYLVQFKAANIFALPPNYRYAFLLGFGALAILLAMAFTSFDKAFHGMGIWWFRLHRLIYVVVALVLFHVFMIGVHASELPVILLLAVVSGMTLAAYWIVAVRGRTMTRWQLGTMVAMTLVLTWAVAYGFHQRHVYLVHSATEAVVSQP